METQLRLLTADEYMAMGACDILHEDERLELIGGQIRRLPALTPIHIHCVNRLFELLYLRIFGLDRRDLILSPQNPFHIDLHHVLAPDIAIIEAESDYPNAARTRLVIEVTDGTAEHDLRVKVPLYADSGIPEVWLVSPAMGRVSVFRTPRSSGYEFTTEFGADRLYPDALGADTVLDVSSFMPETPD